MKERETESPNLIGLTQVQKDLLGEEFVEEYERDCCYEGLKGFTIGICISTICWLLLLAMYVILGGT